MCFTGQRVLFPPEKTMTKTRLVSVLVCISAFLASAFAQTAQFPRSAPRPQRFTTEQIQQSGTGLPTWTGSYTYNNHTYTYVMVGSDPSQGSATTVVKTVIIPLKLTFSDGTVFDANGPLYHKRATATQAVVASPIFKAMDWPAGNVDLGTSQYVDAYQRGNFWSEVSTVSPNYHVLIKPIIAPEQSFNVPASGGYTIPGPLPGTKRGVLNGNYVDQTITGPLFAKFPQITPGMLTLFLTYNVFPAGAYGYHDAFGNNPQTSKTYTYVSYLDPYTNVIDADISTLAHEIAEWVDDPYVNNNTACGLLEVGDPVSDVVFPVTDPHGLVWHPQDLVFIDYFYAPTSGVVNGWYTYRDTLNGPCQ